MSRRFSLRRILQLRLATLLLLITVCCLVLALRQAFVVPYLRQAETVERLEQLGAGLRFERAKPEWLAPFVGRDIYRRLVMIHLEHRGVEDDQLAILREAPDVRYLYLAANPITDRGLRHLAPLRHVERLSLWNTEITDEGLQHLSPFVELRALDIHSTRITDDGLKRLVQHPKLRELLLGQNITNRGLRHVAALPELVALDLRRTWTTPGAIAELPNKKLRLFAVSEWWDKRLEYGPWLQENRGLVSVVRFAPQDDISRLSEEHKNMSSLMVSSSYLDENQWQQIWQSENIRHLNVSDSALTDHDVAGIERMANLQTLVLQTVPLTDAGFEHVARLPNLRRLTITSGTPRRGPQLTQRGLSAVGRMATLQNVGIHYLPIPPDVFRTWKDLAEVSSLTLGGRCVDDASLSSIAELPNLSSLNLCGTSVTDAAIPSILGISTLRTCNVGWTNVTPDGRKQLRYALHARR